MRLRHYDFTAQGRQQEAVQEAMALISAANQQMQTTLVDLDGAVNYLVSGEKEHPNRIDVCNTINTLGQYIPNENMAAPIPGSANSTTLPSFVQPVDMYTQAPFRRSNTLADHYEGQQKSEIDRPSNSLPAVTTDRLQGALNPFTTQSKLATNTSTTTSALRAGSFASPSYTAQSLNAPNQATLAYKDVNGKLSSWKGRPVVYVGTEPTLKRPDGALEKIWFPDPPKWNKEQDVPVEEYDKTVKEDYRYMGINGSFRNRIMPDLPPKREWCSWDI